MSKRIWLLLLTSLLGLAGQARAEDEPGVFTERPASCPPGCTIVEEIRYHQVCKKVCHIEPNVRVLRVPCYDMKCEPICKLRCGKGDPISCKDNGCKKCDCTPPDEYDAPPKGCGKIRERRILIKREVEVEHHHFKCVAKIEVSLVPYRVYRQVPCTGAEAEESLSIPGQ
jgi:hypothetical protein